MHTQFIAIIIAAAFAIPAPAQESRKCAPRDRVVERLAGTYGETRKSIGLGENGMMIETFASRATGTWTITVTTPNMLTCLVASGRSWEELAEALPPKGTEGLRRRR